MFVRILADPPIAEVVLDRPTKLNAVTLPMLDELVAAAREVRSHKEIRAVVLRGEGRSFCAGLDFGSVFKDGPLAIARRFVPRPLAGTNTFQEACWAWRRLPVPVIAAVHGHCFGAGVQLALAADFRFTTPDAQWSVLEGKWGLVPDMSGIRTLAEQVGPDVAKMLTMTGEIVDGNKAVALRLATEVHDDPTRAAHDLAEKLATRSPDAVAAAKRLFSSRWNRSARSTFAAERREQALLLGLPNTAAMRGAARSNTPARLRDRLLR